MTIRRATRADAALLAEHRAAVWHEVGDWSVAELTPQILVWTAFFAARISEDTYVAFIAEEDGRTIGSGALLIHVTIPRPHSDSECAGRIQSVYVIEAARRRGIARAIMERLVWYARDAKLLSLTLRPSDAARPLYAALGFEPADEMLLRFTP